MMLVVGIMLIRFWVTIVDDAKGKRTPPWCDKGVKATMGMAFFLEDILGIVECLITDNGSFRGNVKAVKNLGMAVSVES